MIISRIALHLPKGRTNKLPHKTINLNFSSQIWILFSNQSNPLRQVYTFWLFLSLLLVSALPPAFAQSRVLDFKIYGFEDGMSHRNTFSVSQDSIGFIWVATINGLNRFDGEQFKIYRNQQGGATAKIPQNFITDVACKNRDEVWISHRGGFSNLNPIKNEVSRFRAMKSFPLPKGNWEANNLTFLPDNNIAAVAKNTKTGEQFLIKKNAEDSLEILADLSIATSEVLLHYWNDGLIFNPSPNEVIHINLDGTEKATYPLSQYNRNNPIVDFFERKNGQLTALTANGELLFFERNKNQIRKEAGISGLTKRANAQSLHIRENGDIWIGGYAELWFYDTQTEEWSEHHDDVYQLVKNTCQFREIFEDKMGLIWVASDFGLLKIGQQRKFFTNYLSEGNEHCSNGFCSTRGITSDEQGNVYFSMYNTIQVLNIETDEVQPLFGKRNFYNPPFGLLYHDNHIWTGNGLRINLKTQQVQSMLDLQRTDIGVVTKDPENTIWLGYKNQLFRFRENEQAFERFKDSTGLFDQKENQINYLLPSKIEDAIWIATNQNGIFKINKKTGTELHINADSTADLRLPTQRIIGLQEDSQGNIWMATASGVVRLSANGESLKTFGMKEGLPNSFINGILLEGDSAVWISTDNGLSRLSFGQKNFMSKNLKVKTHRFFNFFEEDGISSNEFNRISFHKADDGRMYFGGLNGVNAFYPNQNMYKAPIYPTVQLVLNNASKYNPGIDSSEQNIPLHNLEDGIELAANDRFFEFDFALLDYLNPAKNQYSYQLEGYDKNWSPATAENQVRFNDVPPGDYTFRLRASALGGKLENHQIALPIHIHKPFYKTTWFYILATLITLGLIWGFIRWREYQLREREQKLEKQVQSRTSELEAEKKKSDDLLLNILPAETAEELKKYGKAKAHRHEQVTVLFSDFRQFSKIAETMEPEILVAEIDLCFRAFDQIIEKYGLEKIKTIGDAYMCAGGIGSHSNEESACNVIRAGLEMQAFLKALKEENEEKGEHRSFESRIGVHTGPIVAGVVGMKKFAYDIWGKTVNIASRMETYGDVGKVNISNVTYEIVNHHFDCKPQAAYMTESDEEIQMYFVEQFKE